MYYLYYACIQSNIIIGYGCVAYNYIVLYA